MPDPGYRVASIVALITLVAGIAGTARIAGTQPSRPFLAITTTSTTNPPLTTTTTLPNDCCVITFRLADEVVLSSLQFLVDYTAAPGEFKGSATSVACAFLLDSAVPANFFDNDSTRELSQAVISQFGFGGPIDVTRCNFSPELSAPKPEDFEVNTISAFPSGGGLPLDPLPDVVISDISCPSGGTTSTTSSTSTTLFAPTTTTTTSSTTSSTLPMGEQCGDASPGGGITPTDALVALRAAVNLVVCELCICDVDESGTVAPTDALKILRNAVNLPEALSCPACV